MMDRILALTVLALVLGVPLGVIFLVTGQFLMDFVFFYPLFMSGLWMAGGLYFWLHWERRWPWEADTLPPALAGEPLISILIPCFNEGENVADTLEAALAQHYPNIEVIAINDGSSDNTGQLLDSLALLDPRLRVIHLAQNQGKAVALRMGAVAARSEYLVCIDGDALLAPHTAAYLVAPLLQNVRLGAVTGNPRIRTRSTLVGRVQVGEFSSIIGLIKRTQRVFGRIFTISGVICAFRRTALDRVGYWSTDMITEDIDISWKLQLDHWSIFYEPRALCWILMPETLRGLWRQRLRWARGGAEVLFKNIRGIWQWNHRYLWPLLFEYCLSTGWAFTLLLSIVFYCMGLFIDMPASIVVHRIVPPAFTGLLLATVCLGQFAVSVLIDRRYEKDLWKIMFWVVWYPLVFWFISFFTTLVSFPQVLFRQSGKRARWVSPDRGIKPVDDGKQKVRS
ncbi:MULTISPECIES: poly-beta-1,6-N-acetyl-D-glucosamine synthase [Pseudomonas]|jgi:biofilm PGA synthesis N-glycosyltransferase PgaC|uniref:Poly-beta-1,6-N-acetyl-D-glucosamine synthase n=1 Tax=Pseudomonas gingeri TaxID=117681 RepID=A0A7Y8BMD5_9PSED|nr:MULTISPECIES: poly-beta-1,6-N-acetyl-D-glucosamine synthase [Pseudomonas]MCU1739403.1 poly-beta-1,6-N-acetyl-D-glucosamine synthase [Pseudomonas sp. 20S_6.2_Bac1]NWB48987.1 poly-beta-1,6 N-acetyl-D-glucosamine synthase [Pseudomonas gingeri]